MPVRSRSHELTPNFSELTAPDAKYDGVEILNIC